MSRWPLLRRWCRRLALAAVGICLLTAVAEQLFDRLCPYPVARLQALEVSTIVEAADGSWLRVVPTARGERVLPLTWAEAPPLLRAVVMVAEDARFFAHDGVDWWALVRAAVTDLRAQRVVSGASTLTMQVVRIVEPRPRTWSVKAFEVLRARQLERCLGKEAIAGVWLQQVPMGGTLRGFAAAAHYWFGRPVAELGLAELAALVAMVPAPSARSPRRHPGLLRARRDALLQRLQEHGIVDAAVVAAAMAQPLGMQPHPWPWALPELADLCVDELRGARPVRCHTGADPGLDAWLRATLRDLSLPGDAAAVVVLDRASGAVRALVGRLAGGPGLDATRRRRSLGSTLKPFLYAMARETGACSEHGLIDDTPLVIGDWQPRNFQRGNAGALSAADALATSNNIAAVRCLQRVGTAAFHDLLLGLGLPPSAAHGDLTAALGTGAASPLELARAWQRFLVDPARVGLSRRSVDWTLRALQRLPLVAGRRGGAMAWKSGTSSGRRDAWCAGVDAQHVVVVWLGNQDGRGDADLVGARSATEMLARLVAGL